MRASLILLLLFLAIGLVWAFQPSAQSFRALYRLEKGQADAAEQLLALRRAGADAAPALKAGLKSAEPRVRLVCARELSRMGDAEGDQLLLRMLQQRETFEEKTLASAAETFIIDVWNERSAPPESDRNAVLQPSSDNQTVSDRIERLNRLLEQYPLWTQGLIFRARLLIALDRAPEARRDALTALLIQPDQFEAMVVLSRAWALLGRPDYSVTCMERAGTVNPRLKETLSEELQAFQRMLERERGKERVERRKLKPAA